MRIDVYSDISCPWCYLAVRNLRAATAQYGEERIEVLAHPYQIDGENPDRPVPVLDFLSRKYGPDRARRMSEEVTAAGAGLGVRFNNEKALAVNTVHAHRLLWMAGREYGWRVRADVEENLFAEWFVHGGNVADAEVLVRCAVAAGVAPARAERLVASDEYLAAVRARIAETRVERAAVPVVVFDRSTRIEHYQSSSRYLAALLAAARTDASGSERS